MKGFFAILALMWIVLVVVLTHAAEPLDPPELVASSIVAHKNFSGQQTPSLIAVEYRGCNFSQPSPVFRDGKWVGRRLFPGNPTVRTFIECNLTNATPPPGSTLTRCNTTIRQNRVETGTEIVTINSAGTTATLRRYVNRIHGRLDPVTLEPVYRAQVYQRQAEPPEGSRDRRIGRIVEARQEARAEMLAREAEAAVEVSK